MALFENKGSFYAHVPENYNGSEPLDVIVFYNSDAKGISYEDIGKVGRIDTHVYYEYAENNPNTIVILNKDSHENADAINAYLDELTAQGIPMKPKYEFSHSKSFGDSLQDTIKSYESGHPVALTVSMDSTASCAQLVPGRTVDGGGVLTDEDIVAFSKTGSRLVIFEETEPTAKFILKEFVDREKKLSEQYGTKIQVPITYVTCGIGGSNFLYTHAGINDEPITTGGLLYALNGSKDHLNVAPDGVYPQNTGAYRINSYQYEYWDYDANRFVSLIPDGATEEEALAAEARIWGDLSTYWKSDEFAKYAGPYAATLPAQINTAKLVNLSSKDIIFDSSRAFASMPPSNNLVVHKDELNAFLSSNMLNALSTDETDASNLSTLIANFVGNTVLMGDAWNLVYAKMGKYDNALNQRVQAAVTLGDALRNAINKLLDCLTDYPNLDTSQLEELNELSAKLKADIDNLASQLRDLSAISDPNERARQSSFNDRINKQIAELTVQKEEVDKHIKAIAKLKSTYDEVLPDLQAALDTVNSFSSVVADIAPSDSYTYVA